MSGVVVVVGEGFLAGHVSEELADTYEVIHRTGFEDDIPLSADPDLVLVVHDTWRPSVHQQAEETLRPKGVPWLRGFVAFGEGVVGPLVRPGRPGCTKCADMRRLMAGRERKEMSAIEQKLAENGGIEQDPWASRTGLLQLAYLLGAEVHKIVQGRPAASEESMFLMNLKTMECSSHFVLPDSLCPVCSSTPDDTPTEACITLQPSLKISADSYRCRSIDELNAVLSKNYVDHRTGVLNGKMYDFTPPFADVIVNLPLFGGDEGTAGRTHSYAVSEATAILEGLERSCGIGPRGKQTVVHDCFRNLEEHALNPLTVGVHADEQYARPDFPYKKFHRDRKMSWVWGYSLIEERPILVPELLAYYSMGCGGGFVFETSNGCALGGSLEEAILYGIFEVVERDSFLLTWYGKLPLPRLDLYSAQDEELSLMADRVRAVAGYELYVYNSTMENGIPSVWAMAKNRKQKGMNLLCAAGAHLDPVRAVKSAVHELAGMMQTFDEKLEAEREKYERMFHDDSLVQTMEDHGLLYGLPQAEERLHFLFDDHRPLRTFADEFPRKAGNENLTEDLRDILNVFQRLQLDVIVVDQTSPEIKRNGLYCVKVLIPGMLPMTFGHHLTRLTGLQRVLNVPVELGYTEQPLTPEQLNPRPHPFP